MHLIYKVLSHRYSWYYILITVSQLVRHREHEKKNNLLYVVKTNLKGLVATAKESVEVSQMVIMNCIYLSSAQRRMLCRFYSKRLQRRQTLRFSQSFSLLLSLSHSKASSSQCYRYLQRHHQLMMQVLIQKWFPIKIMIFRCQREAKRQTEQAADAEIIES